MTKTSAWTLSLAVATACVLGSFVAAQGPAAGALTGTVTSADGKPVEGVVVSARAAGRPFTTSVFTNAAGSYTFPPLAAAQYRVWAQAVGFEAAGAEADLSAGRPARRDLTLRPLEQFDGQLTGEEWVASLPETTPAERREKALFVNNCTACHQAGFPLQNRFDASGWGNIVDLMARTGGLGGYQQDRVAFPLIAAYRDELVAFLTRHRGPNSPPLAYKLAPRPQGAATNVIVTEYDLTPGSAQDYLSVHNGTDWSRGTPSAYEGRSAHDVAIAPDGNVWFTDQGNPDRTIGMVDVKTGAVKGWKLGRQIESAAAVSEDNLPVAGSSSGTSVGTHGLAFDRDGALWWSNAAEGTLTKFMPRTEEFVRYPRPAQMNPVASTVVELDSKGNVWSLTRQGAVRLDPKTGVYTEYRSLTPDGDHYGMTIDSRDNVWWTQIGKDRLGVVDGQTGKVGEVVLAPSTMTWLTDKDRTLADKYPSNNISAVPQLKGPRRMAADPTNDNLWVAQYFGDRLTRINIRTRAIAEYPVPRPYMQPYAVVVDRNHMVWITVMNTDRILRFDPSTERFTEYVLPTRGTEIRHIEVDDRAASPTVWLPYWRANKIASLQLR